MGGARKPSGSSTSSHRNKTELTAGEMYICEIMSAEIASQVSVPGTGIDGRYEAHEGAPLRLVGREDDLPIGEFEYLLFSCG